MIVTIQLLPYGKYLLASGEVPWGRVDLVATTGPGWDVTPGITYPISEFEVSPPGDGNGFLIPKASCSVVHNFQTEQTELRCTGFIITGSVSSGIVPLFIAHVVPGVGTSILRPLMSLTIDASVGSPLDGSAVLITAPDDVFAYL